jgi:hypothetical protein
MYLIAPIPTGLILYQTLHKAFIYKFFKKYVSILLDRGCLSCCQSYYGYKRYRIFMVFVFGESREPNFVCLDVVVAWFQVLSGEIGDRAAMKNKLFNFITISVATSLLLAPGQKVYTFAAEPQTNIKETQPLVENPGSRQDNNCQGTQNQALTQESQVPQSASSQPDPPMAGASQTNNLSQPSSVAESPQLNNTVGGVFVTFLFLGYVLAGLQYRRYRARRAATLLQQIETLERIWRMKPQER